MKAADRLSKALGTHINESMGAKRAGGDDLASNPFPSGTTNLGGNGAEKYKGAARVKDAFSIELGRLARDADQPRKEFDPEELERLAESLKTRGQLQPIRVRYDERLGRWIIISGERRYRAAMMAGLSTLVAVETKGEISAEDILEDQLVENCVREDLKPIEQARAFRALIDRRGYSYRQLADALSISHQVIVRALSLLGLPADIQEKVDAGLVSPTVASEVARVEDEKERRELIAEVEAGSLTRKDVARVVQARGPVLPRAGKSMSGRKPQAPVDDRPRRASNGVKIRVEATPRHSMADVVQALRDIADLLESRSSISAA
jgi:ParB family transcriptional regulator, chromosome partitioning protein